VEAQVESCGKPSGTEDVAFVDPEDIWVDGAGREQGRELIRGGPVSGRAATVQQTGEAEHESAGAQTRDPGAAVVCLRQRRQHGIRWWICEAHVTRNDYEVRCLERIEPPAEVQIEAVGRGDPTGSDSTRGERVVAGGVAKPSWPPKRLSNDAKLERDDPGHSYRRNASCWHKPQRDRASATASPPRRSAEKPVLKRREPCL
jgi:hypothetical protein